MQFFLKEEEADIYISEGACSVAWYEHELSGNHKRVYIAIFNSQVDQSSVDDAYKLVNEARNSDLSKYVQSHQEWWEVYYKESYLTLTDKKWEKFYWLQMYKLGCAVDKGIGVIDSQGPWLTITPWPTTVWNLNVQLSYMSLYTSNRIDLAQSLIKSLKANE